MLHQVAHIHHVLDQPGIGILPSENHFRPPSRRFVLVLGQVNQ